MANSRIIVNLSPSFVKVMPFECKGKNELVLTSYTNKFQQITKGLVCIFRAEETNNGAVKIKLSNVEKEIKLLTQDKKDLFTGTLKAGDFYEASFDGVDLILHEKQLNVSAGNNINIQKSKDGKLVISADNTDTWRPIGDSLDSAEKDKSASLYALNILYKKYQAIEKIISETKSTVIGYDTKIIAINKNIENVLNEITMLKKALESSNEKIKTVENKNQALEGEITGTKKELVELTKHVAEVGNNNFVKVQRNRHGFVTGDVLTLSGNIWNLTKQNETGVAICVMIDVNNFLAIYSGIREYQGDIKDSLGKTVIENTIYYCSGTPGKCTSTKPLEMSQKAFFVFGNGGRKYIKNILNGITDKPEKRIDTSNLVTKEELKNATTVYDDGSNINVYTEPSKQHYPDSDLAREGASKIRIPRNKYYRACNYMGGFLKFEISIFRGPGDAVAIVNGYVGVDRKYDRHKLIVTDSMFLDNDVDLFIGLSYQGGTKGEHYSLWFKYIERDNYMEISNFKCKFEAVKTTGRITALEDNYDHFKLDMLEDPRGKDDPFGFPPIPKNVFSVNGVPVGALTRDEVSEMLSGLGLSLDKKIENKADKNHGTHLPAVTVNDKGKYLKGDLTWGDITLQGLGGLSKAEIQKMIPVIPTMPTAATL
uniref:hypothetical protein n=1 Tax=uncultured Cetobacterium sp. TaxID=527638 RepID=UPI002607CBD8